MITELTAKTTSQELFDYITTFLLKQGEPSMDSKCECKYRSGKGLMCAFGCVIPDSIYRKSMENILAASVITDGIGGNYSKDNIDYFKALSKHRDLLERLQSVHDSATTSDVQGSKNRDLYRSRVRAYWIKKFGEIATKSKLKFTPPTL